MYLARTYSNNRYRYVLRESFKTGGIYRHRDLFDLGSNPTDFIIYPGGNAYYIDEVIEDRLAALGIKKQADTLDDIFWPYVRSDIRRSVGAFRNRGNKKQSRRLSGIEEKKIHLRTHLFDKRRIHYLRTGRLDQRGLGRIPAHMLGWLQKKSRDEIEQAFMRQERILRTHELKTYLYVIFDLRRFFTTILADRAPEMLDRDAMDDHFIREICRLNQSATFWGDPSHGKWLHRYLVRYLIIYFDCEFPSGRLLREELEAFINRHRAYQPLKTTKRVGLAQASKLFRVSKETLEMMSSTELTRLYRQLALKNHPDHGGDPDMFIRINEAYRSMIRTKRKRSRGAKPNHHRRQP